MKYRLSIIGMTAAVMIAAGSYAQELTDLQKGDLEAVAIEYTQKGIEIEKAMESKLLELATELHRKGRLDSEESAKESSKRGNAILKDLGDLYGQFIKVKVEAAIAAKNVLTQEQRVQLLSQLQPQASLPYDTIEYMQPDIFDLPLNLDIKQRKKLVELEADLLVKEVELERDVELTILDLEAALISSECGPKIVDPLLMKLAELAGREIDNRVGFFLKAKDVLTLDQKRLLSSLIGLE